MPRTKINFGLARFSGLYLWAIIIITFGIWTPDLFLSMLTVHSIASSQAIVAMVALAALISLSSGAFDVSIGAVANLATVVVVMMQTEHGQGMWVSILIAVLVSALIGMVNGFLIVKLQITSVVATLGMGSVILAVQEILTGAGQPLPPADPAWGQLTQRDVLGFQIVFFYLIALAVIVWWFMAHTPGGRYIYAIGGNAEAARLSGVRVGRWTWLSLTISSTICGIAGVAYASSTGPSLTYGGTMLLPAFAAVFLGSTQLIPGRFNVWGTMLAVFVLATGVQGLQFVTGVNWLAGMFNGVAVIVAVGFAGWRARNVAFKLKLLRGRRQEPAGEVADAA